MSLFYLQHAAAKMLGSLFKRPVVDRLGKPAYSKKKLLSQFLTITLLLCLIGSQLIGLRHAIAHSPLSLGHAGPLTHVFKSWLPQVDLTTESATSDDPLLPDSSIGHHCQLLDAATLADLVSSVPIIFLPHQFARHILTAPERSLLSARLMRLYDGRAPPTFS